MNEAPGPINFTMFLTMFGEKLNGTDPEDVIRNAFACFDEEGTGELSVFIETGVKLYVHLNMHVSNPVFLISSEIISHFDVFQFFKYFLPTCI